MKSIISLLLTCTVCLAQQKPWPTLLKGTNLAKITAVKSNDSSQIYRGKFFKFISDSKLKPNEMRRFAVTADSAYYALEKSR